MAFFIRHHIRLRVHRSNQRRRQGQNVLRSLARIKYRVRWEASKAGMPIAEEVKPVQ